MKKYFLPVSLIIALTFSIFGQGFLLLLIPSSYTQTYKMFESGMIQFLSVGVLAFILTSKSKGKDKFQVPHLRF